MTIPRRVPLTQSLVRGLRPGQVAQLKACPPRQRAAMANRMRDINSDMRQSPLPRTRRRNGQSRNVRPRLGPPRPVGPLPRAPQFRATNRWNRPRQGPMLPRKPIMPQANGPTSDNSDAFKPKPPPLNDSESRSTVVNGGYAKQISTSMATVIEVTTTFIASNKPTDEFLRQAGKIAAPVEERFAALIVDYPPLLTVLPMNGPVGYRLYTPVIVDDKTTGTAVVGGIASEDFGIEAFGTREEYNSLVTGEDSAREYAEKFTGSIVESKPAKHSFRMRNTTPAMSQGGTIRQLRMTSGYDDPVWAGGSYLEVFGLDTKTDPAKTQNHPFYFKRYSMYVEALDFYKDLLASISASSAFRASSGADFIQARQGNCTASDAVYANTYEEQCEVNNTVKETMRRNYAKGAKRSQPQASATSGSLLLERYVFRTALLAGTPTAAYDLTWTQEELRTKMLTGASFPYGSWPSFGNIGFTVDPLTLVGLELRFPASGGLDYVVVDVDPASPSNDGLIHMNIKDSVPEPAPTSTGFTPVGDGWSKIDIPQLLLISSDLFVGLRYTDNVTNETYIITEASMTHITSVPDGPSVQVNPGLMTVDEVVFDPMTATIQHPRFTPFCVVFDAVMTSINTPFSINSYELTIRGMQFARFQPGSLLGNAMKPQIANPTRLRAIRNKEESKGSSLAKVVTEVAGMGIRALASALL